MAKNKKIKKRIKFLLITSMTLILGCFGIYEGLLLTRIEIDPTGSETIARIHKKPLIPIFKDTDIEVPKVYQAIMTRKTRHDSSFFSFFNYRVELKAPNWKIVPITTYSVLGYFSNRKLTNQINESIQNKIPFTTQFRDLPFFFAGLFLVLIAGIFIYVEVNEIKRERIKREERKNKRKKLKESPECIQQPAEPKPEKYKDINDSIIK